MLNNKQAQVLTRRLDKIANHVESRYSEIGLSKKEAYDFCLYLDETADLLEKAAEKDHDMEDEEVDSRVLQKEQDEPYMDAFENSHAPHQTEPDEPYMNHFEENPHTQVVDDDDLVPMNNGDWGVSASESNWYTRSKAAASGSDNWYTRSKSAKESTGSNWYDGGNDWDLNI